MVFDNSKCWRALLDGAYRRINVVAVDALVGNEQGHAATNFPRKNNRL
jgi:hypothetical protein